MKVDRQLRCITLSASAFYSLSETEVVVVALADLLH